VRHNYFGRQQGEDAFTDLLFNALLGFAFMFVTAFALISEPSDGGKISPNAEILITIRWPDEHPDDVDTIVEDPRGTLLWYNNKDTEIMHLDRDDRGSFQDAVVVGGKKIVNPINQETVTVRNLVPGEYVINLLHYQANYSEPLRVTVKVEKLNPKVSLEHYGSYELTGVGHELTALRFNVDSEGLIGGISFLQKPLVVKVAKG
jgi:hypothetical protein